MSPHPKLDLLVLSAHPDDAELGCGGTIARHISMGQKVGIVDFTRGELGTRGTAETRKQEAADSAAVLGLTVRENLGLADGFFENVKDQQLLVVQAIRKFRPTIVLANAIYDRHSDHGRAADLATNACFVSGLMKVETYDDGVAQPPWRPQIIYHFIQSQLIIPDIIVDISEFWELKMKSIHAFKTQFYDPNSKEPESYISRPGFLKLVEARAIEFGHAIDVQYGEGFTVKRPLGVKSLSTIF
jgi:N-acetylglucosamine malate deacetylase 1